MDFQQIFETTLKPLSHELKGKVVVDLPAGEGKTTKWLQGLGAQALPMDLFPEFFKQEGIFCQPCDLNDHIPLKDSSADFVISQEGIEHIQDQVRAFREFSRVLKVGGRLILTAPNGSSLTSKVSHLLNESEKYGRIMPPNLVDGLWCNSSEKDKIYFGHLFVPGANKLRVLGEVAGLELAKVHFSEVKISNVFWFVLLYPFIFLTGLKNYFRNCRKKPAGREEYKKAFLLSVNPKILIDGSLVLEFSKVRSPDQAQAQLYEQWSHIQKNVP